MVWYRLHSQEMTSKRTMHVQSWWAKHMCVCNARDNKLTIVYIWPLARPEPAVSHVCTLIDKIPADIKNTTIISRDGGGMVKSTQNLQASMHMGVQTKYIIGNAAGTRYTDSAKMRSSQIGSQIELQYLLRRQDWYSGWSLWHLH